MIGGLAVRLRHNHPSSRVERGTARPMVAAARKRAEMPAVKGCFGLPVHQEDLARADALAALPDQRCRCIGCPEPQILISPRKRGRSSAIVGFCVWSILERTIGRPTTVGELIYFLALSGALAGGVVAIFFVLWRRRNA